MSIENRKSKISFLDERSDEVKEIIGKTPNWMISWGTALIFMIVISLIISTFFVSYDEIIKARIVVTTTIPPAYIKTNSSGIFTSLLAKTGQSVRQGQILAEINNSANFNEVYKLKKKLSNFKLKKIAPDSIFVLFPKELKLGMMTTTYSNFVASYQNYILYHALQSSKSNIKILNDKFFKEIKNIDKLSIISDQELPYALKQSLVKNLEILKNEITNWEHQYIIKSPLNGRITMFDKRNNYKNVNKGETIFIVVPKEINPLIGQITMPIKNSGKLRIGQYVKIKVDNYPFDEWGSIQGNISDIYSIPIKGEAIKYIQVKIENLETSQKKELEFNQEMQGDAEIITEELSVFERIFYQIRNVLNNS